ncbi:hypothetical protein HMPREF9447_01934 [Bacteroides oleiciplenus YIT 12058]|uniref:Uncharacterized protein n=1 Tax=Bacteroides oleiciplenus YIT 12058 TaxID=742727 RepID=K9E455_9BACE|nr:hypothetical protein HMPREF9447_01934 [Bacteroides oleiciplenus YIT 12058]
MLYLFEKGFANLLLILCQSSAKALAIFCHRIGKLLPLPWQDFAKALARRWQSSNYVNRLLTLKITSC